jgi:6-phosphogluconolactonase
VSDGDVTAASLEPSLVVVDDPRAASELAADLLIAWLAAALSRRGQADVALTGGSSAAGLYRALREPERVGAIDWSRVHAWLGDDRFVPLDHPDSNGGLALRDLVADGSGPLPRTNLHPVPVDGTSGVAADPVEAARRYADEVVASVPAIGGVPAFDVVLLGVGSDGHLLSVFPGSPALAPGAPLGLAVEAPTHIAPHVARVTLSPAILDAAVRILVITTGAAKASVLAQVLGPIRDPSRWPAQLARRGTATWILDRACAAQVEGSIAT